IFVTQGFDRNLVIMPEHSFVELYQRVTNLNMADPLARLLLRMVLGNAVLTRLDENRQMHLDKRLYDYAEFPQDAKAVLVGQGDHVEVWSQACWSQQNTDLQDVSMNAYRFAALDLRV
ncbi:MAG: hypothetical protein L3J16_08055, partial [Anaerolineales bacterium]|nr:hypothetical protein [Anaerolineales bacterium]